MLKNILNSTIGLMHHQLVGILDYNEYPHNSFSGSPIISDLSLIKLQTAIQLLVTTIMTQLHVYCKYKCMIYYVFGASV